MRLPTLFPSPDSTCSPTTAPLRLPALSSWPIQRLPRLPAPPLWLIQLPLRLPAPPLWLIRLPLRAPALRPCPIQLPQRVPKPSPKQPVRCRYSGCWDWAFWRQARSPGGHDESTAERLNHDAQDGKSTPTSGRAEPAEGDACAFVEIPRPRTAAARLFLKPPGLRSRGRRRP